MIKRIIATTAFCCLCVTSVAVQAVPEIQHWTTSNGMRVFFVPAPELPMVDIRVAIDAGSARDGKLPGLASLTAGLLDAGSGDLDVDEIAASFDNVGANFSAGARRDLAQVSLRSLIDPALFDPALDTFIRILAAPSFPEKDFARAKNLTLVGLQAQKQDPGDIGSKAFYKAIYGDHPFAQPVSGTEESIKAVARADVQAFHKQYFVARNSVLAIVGQLDRKGAEALAEKISSALPEGAAAASLPPVKALSSAETIRIPFPSQQAHVFMGHPGMQRGDPDYFSLYVGNHVLGGSGFQSRLVKEVRVQRGLSYSVYSYFAPQRVPGPFQIGLQTRVDQVDDAVQVVRDTVQQYIDEGPNSTELTASTRNITGGFPLRIDSNGDVVEYLAVIGFYGLPTDYLNVFNDRITAVDAQTIRSAFKRRVKPGQMVTVIVGG